MFIDPEEGSRIIEDYLKKFRDALFVLSDDNCPKILTAIQDVYVQFGFVDPRRHWDIEEKFDSRCQAVLDYLDARAFFFKSDSGFGELAGDLNINLQAVRKVLREEETDALRDGKLLDVNLHALRPSVEWLLDVRKDYSRSIRSETVQGAGALGS